SLCSPWFQRSSCLPESSPRLSAPARPCGRGRLAQFSLSQRFAVWWVALPWPILPVPAVLLALCRVVAFEPCHTKSFAGIAGCRNSRNLYFFLPRARPVPVKSGADGGPRRSTEVVLNEQPLPVAWRSQRGGVVRAVMDPGQGNVVGLCRSMRRQRAKKPPEGVAWGIEAHPKYRRL